MHWYNVTVSTASDDLEKLEDCLWSLGAVSVTVEDLVDDPIFEPGPGETPVWASVLVTGLFENDVDLDHLRSNIGLAGFAVQTIDPVKDRVWEREWLNRFQPMQFGRRLWVCPTGFEVPEKDAVVIQLDPGLAFGTGTHETTRLCLEYLDSLTLTGQDVIDYGCGSGILGVAALLLGADSVQGIDNDPQALAASRENAQRNDVVMQLQLPGGSLESADLVIANILAQPLVELSEQLIEILRPAGKLVLSGIMSSQKEWVETAYREHLLLEDSAELNGWVRLVWSRP